MCKKFISDDYFHAYRERSFDIQNFKNSNSSLVIRAYLAGVAVECILRGNICKFSKEFDGRHNLSKLLIDSKITEKNKNITKKEERILIDHIQKLNTFWNNSLRYYSVKKLRTIFAHQIAKQNNKEPEQFLENRMNSIIEIANKIIQMGEQYGFNR